MEIKRLPEDIIAAQNGRPATPGRFDPQVIEGGFSIGKATDSGSPAGDEGVTKIPLLGRIAAGTPIEALRDNSNWQQIPTSMLGAGEYYCLDVDGDSMVDAGILDGDTVIIERCDNAESGAIVVALVESNEVTLKRLRKRNNSVALEPANPDYEIRIFGPDQVKVQGHLVGLMRKF